MISNYCSFFINGGERVSFTYEGGSTLFHFCPHDNQLESHLVCNVIFFANDEQHALVVLKRMFEFRIKAFETYSQNNKEYIEKYGYGFMQDHESSHNANVEMIKEWLKALMEGKIKVTKAPMNQFYKVGWASNDTLG